MTKRAPDAIWHVSLSSGRRTRSPRYMTRDADVASADALIGSSLAHPDSEIAMLRQRGCTVRIHVQAGALLATPFARIDGVPVPLVTLGVAIRERQAARIWRLLHQQPSPDQPPATDPGAPAEPPWCAVRDEVGLAHLPEAAGWLPNWELAVAWAWLERRG